MSTSSSYDFSLNRDQISTAALQLLGVIGSSETASSNDLTLCSNFLNMMIKSWQAQGIHLWKETDAVVLLVNGQYKYTLSSSSSDKAGDNPLETTLSAAAIASATSLTVTSTSGMTAADVISIELDANTSHNTTIVSVDSSTTLTITSGLASAAASGSRVTTWTTNLNRPLNITNCRYHYVSGLERKMKKMGKSEYDALPTKTTSTGPSTAFYYTPKLSNGILYVWPVPSSVEDTLRITYSKSMEDFDSASNDPDFPQEWLTPIIYNLAVLIAPAFGITLSKMNPDIAITAKTLLAETLAWDSEEGSVRIVPNYRYDDHK